ncbi:hypothetical protein ACOIOT_004480 [Cronobacter turicensis]
MKKSQHIINGRAYDFQTDNGETHLVYYSHTRPVTENHVETVCIPSCKIITRSNGDILFAHGLKEGEMFEILTAKSLYDRYAWQWFEPLADNYHPLIYFNHEQIDLHYHSLRECRETGKPVRKVLTDIFWYSLMAYRIGLTLSDRFLMPSTPIGLRILWSKRWRSQGVGRTERLPVVMMAPIPMIISLSYAARFMPVSDSLITS